MRTTEKRKLKKSEGARHIMENHPVSKDNRYTVSKEFCGYIEARHVARFCGEWIGQSRFYGSACMLCVGHSQNGPVIEEVTA